MTAGDVDAFTTVFASLRAIFPLRADKAELGQLQRLYFRALDRFTIDQVEAAVEALTATATHFPKPAEWIKAVPRETSTLPPLEPDQAAEHRRAIALRYEDEPCGCFVCRQAGVSHRFLRFVAVLDDDGRDVRALLDGRPVTRGYWAHGDELRRYYEARDAFFALAERFKGKTPRPMPGSVPRGTSVTDAMTAQSHGGD